MATRSDYAYYPKLWQKSFLIEIVRKDNGTLLRSFAFSMPPESVSIDVPQRVNIKKTFGGHFVDDYGVDSIPISIKGSTGNSQFKEIYWASTTRYVDGKNEAFLIISKILQYKYELKDYDKYEMRLYDLSSVAEAMTGAMLTNAAAMDVNGWRVVLRDGKIERSKEKPMFYNYSIDFLAVEPIGVKNPSYSVKYSMSAIEKIMAKIDKLKANVNNLKKALASYRSFVDKIRLVEQGADALAAGARDFYRTVQGFIDTTATGINSAYDIILFPFDLVVDLFNGVRDVRQSFEAIFQDYSNSITNLENKAIKLQETINYIFGLEQDAADIVQEAKGAGALPEVHIVPNTFVGAYPALNAADSSSELDDIGYILTYGYTEIIATSETRLDELSNKIYGSPDYADLIAKFNGITGDSQLTPGMVVKLPYLSYTTALRDSEIYSYGTETYGTDIQLAPDGDLVLAEFNDYNTTSGLANMEQAIILRMSEDQGARVRLLAYGIKQSRGNFDPFSLAILVTSIRDSLIRDSRIQSAFNFTLQQDSDLMVLSYDVELENGVTQQFSISL